MSDDVRDRLQRAVADDYRLERELGRGGMATVYLARDLRHDRQVALKVLHPELGAVLGAERFLNEIRLTARLQHPNILPLFDSGQADGLLFYVIPFIDGESLRARLDREKQLPVEEAVRIAQEAAGALAYAHRQGVIHRDVKPENILLQDGQALVSDFGIGLVVSAARGSRMTQTGISLGTPQYMSPEQAAGERDLTPRSDVYSLACVVYEMLVGEPPFTGPNAQAVFAKAMTESPAPLCPRRRTIPPYVEAAVLRALEKLPADRFATALEFSAALAGTMTSGPAATLAWTRPTAAAGRRRARLAVIGAGLAAVVAAFLAGRAAARPDAEPFVVSSISPPPHEEFQTPDFALAPDGSRIAFVTRGARPRLWVRPLDQADAMPLDGTEGAGHPFWSPDGTQVGFFADGTIKIVGADGGPVHAVARVPGGADLGGSWGAHGAILFAAATGPIYRVSVSGGTPVPVTRLDSLRRSHRRPFFLPDGRYFLFSLEAVKGIYLGDLSSGKQWLLRGVGGDAEYSDGFALFRIGSAFTDEGQNLYAQRLDLLNHRLTGPLYPVAQNITHPGNLSSYSVSEGGRLVYHAAREEQYAIWMDRSGKRLDSLPPGPYWTLAISHAGTQVALGGYGLLVYDDTRKVVTRLAPGDDRYLSFPVWAPGDTAVAARGRIGGITRDLWVASPGGTEHRLFEAPTTITPTDWSADGKSILLTALPADSTGSQDIWRYDVASGTASPLLAWNANQREGRLSPDGRWIAYQSDETGTDEVYVRPYPGEGTPVRVSTAGGGSPRWRADGRELFYMGADGTIMAVGVRPGRALELSAPVPLFAPRVRRDPLAQSATIYDVAPDGKRFLILGPEPGATAPLTLVQHWTSLLERRD